MEEGFGLKSAAQWLIDEVSGENLVETITAGITSGVVSGVVSGLIKGIFSAFLERLDASRIKQEELLKHLLEKIGLIVAAEIATNEVNKLIADSSSIVKRCDTYVQGGKDLAWEPLKKLLDDCISLIDHLAIYNSLKTYDVAQTVTNIQLLVILRLIELASTSIDKALLLKAGIQTINTSISFLNVLNMPNTPNRWPSDQQSRVTDPQRHAGKRVIEWQFTDHARFPIYGETVSYGYTFKKNDGVLQGVKVIDFVDVGTAEDEKKRVAFCDLAVRNKRLEILKDTYQHTLAPSYEVMAKWAACRNTFQAKLKEANDALPEIQKLIAPRNVEISNPYPGLFAEMERKSLTVSEIPDRGDSDVRVTSDMLSTSPAPEASAVPEKAYFESSPKTAHTQQIGENESLLSSKSLPSASIPAGLRK